LLTIEDLVPILRAVSVMALYCRRSRDPYSLPPVVKIPGDHRLLFLEETVEDWLADPTKYMPKELRPKKPVGRPRKHPTNGA
jgi:hypothetical protein